MGDISKIDSLQIKDGYLHISFKTGPLNIPVRQRHYKLPVAPKILKIHPSQGGSELKYYAISEPTELPFKFITSDRFSTDLHGTALLTVMGMFKQS